MQKKPSIKALILESHKFIWENRDWALFYFMPLAIPVLVLATLSGIGSYYSNGFLLCELVSIYFSGCFILAWHRAFLMGPRREHKVLPFALKPGEGKFIALVYTLGLAPFLWLSLPVVFMVIGKAAGGALGVLVAALISIPLFIWGIVKISRWFFIFPARSMNDVVTFKEASHISKGVLMPFIASAFISGFVISFAFAIPAAICGAIMGAFFDPDSLTFTIGLYLLVTLPSLVVAYYIMALNVGILSRLYQWAVQERG